MRTCRRRWRLAVLGGMLGVLAACSGGDPAPAAPTPPSPPPPPPALPAGIRGVSVAPRDVTVMDGASELFIGWTFDRPADAPRPSVAVRVSDSTVASAAIDSDGIVVRPLRAGRAVVRVSASVSANASYSAATREDSLVVSVVRASVARVDLTLFGALARVGDNVTVAIALRDSVGNELSGRSVQVVSSDTAVLRVTPSGSFWTVQARAVGTASIVAQSEGRSVSEAFTIGSTAAPPPALPSAINVGILASSLLAGTTTVAPVSFPGVAATTRVVVSGVSSSSPEVATATFDSVRGLVLRAASAGRTVLRLAVTGDGPGVSSTSRTYDVATVVYAPNATLGNGFGGDQFALIPPGSFRMGSTVTTRTDEGPVRTVTITRPFRMQRTEVTRAQWRSVMDSLPPQSSRCPIDACPVDAVSWREVQEFIRRLNLRDPGRAYRLPTEAQWEYAARAGATGLSPVAPGGLNASAWVTNVIWSWPVAVLLPNAFGLHDVVGNLWEWVADWYAVDYYTRAPAVDPPGPDSTGVRSYRGGAVGSGVARSTLSARGGGAPEGRFADVGFRLVRDP